MGGGKGWQPDEIKADCRAYVTAGSNPVKGNQQTTVAQYSGTKLESVDTFVGVCVCLCVPQSFENPDIRKIRFTDKVLEPRASLYLPDL